MPLHVFVMAMSPSISFMFFISGRFIKKSVFLNILIHRSVHVILLL